MFMVEVYTKISIPNTPGTAFIRKSAMWKWIVRRNELADDGTKKTNPKIMQTIQFDDVKELYTVHVILSKKFFPILKERAEQLLAWSGIK